MTKILLLIDAPETTNQIYSILNDIEYEIIEINSKSNDSIDEIISQIENYDADIILADENYPNCDFILRQIRTNSKNQNIQILLLTNKNYDISFLDLSDGIIQTPIKDEVLIFNINSHHKIKQTFDRLYENNKELSRSLYQLNVLYNTSSQFTGTLNTKKLYEIMIEAMEKTLSFDISSALILNSEKKPVFNLNTLHPPSENLIDALKIRSVLNYKTIQDDNSSFYKTEFDDIEIVQKTKQMRSNKIFSIETINYDSLFAPIKVGDDFFGVVELFRQIPFSPEDVTCFQAITHQVALPLRSAKLYEEISITNKKLEKLEKLKSEFVSIVSHELRTPLTPINNSLEIVLEEQTGPITPEAKNFILMAKRNIQRLSGIIEDLLDLSRIQAGKLDFKYKTVDITSSLELLKNTFLQVANEKEIQINLEIKEKLPEIYADIRRIEQIFTNLVSNSLKFTAPKGYININVDIIESDTINYDNLISPVMIPNGKYIKVSVKDNGIGIKKEDIPKIFDKFSQIESSLNRNKGGVGLGLTITKQLIDSHLGLIEVQSKEQDGSEFIVYLPLCDKMKTFELDLSCALRSCDDVGVIRIVSNKDTNIINILKDNKLLNLTKLSKEAIFETQDNIDYYAFIPKITQSSFDSLFGAIFEYSQKIKQKECDIMLYKAHSMQYGSDLSKIIKILTQEGLK